MIVQIYEIQTPEEAERCIELGVDHLGSVILSADRPLLPDLKEVIRLVKEADAISSMIPLFSDEEPLYAALDYYAPHYVHLCDSLTDENGRERFLDPFVQLQKRLKEKFPEIGIMRSIPVPKDGGLALFPTLEIAQRFEPVTDVFLTDTWLGKEPVEGYIGITGEPSNRGLTGELVHRSSIPVILAGGLSPETVYETILKVLPAGADSCTRTNRVDAQGRPIRFKKDFSRVDSFVREVRKAEEVIQSKKETLNDRMRGLKAELAYREEALPAHSVRPHQLQAIEALEEEMAEVANEIRALEATEWKLR